MSSTECVGNQNGCRRCGRIEKRESNKAHVSRFFFQIMEQGPGLLLRRYE
jgi:hypothetical protein